MNWAYMHIKGTGLHTHNRVTKYKLTTTNVSFETNPSVPLLQCHQDIQSERRISFQGKKVQQNTSG